MIGERDQGQIPEFVNLELSLDELAKIAEGKGIPLQIVEGPTGLRELQLDIDRVLIVSNVFTSIWESRNPDGSCKVRTFKDFLPAINRLLGPGSDGGEVG